MSPNYMLSCITYLDLDQKTLPFDSHSKGFKKKKSGMFNSPSKFGLLCTVSSILGIS